MSVADSITSCRQLTGGPLTHRVSPKLREGPNEEGEVMIMVTIKKTMMMIMVIVMVKMMMLLMIMMVTMEMLLLLAAMVVTLVIIVKHNVI